MHCGTKFAVRAITDGLRKETRDPRVALVSPGPTRAELTQSGGDDQRQGAVRTALRDVGIDAQAIAEAIGHTMGPPEDVNVSEVIVQGTASVRPDSRLRRAP